LKNQSAISKIEKRTDMYLSTLRSYIEMMDRHLEIQAVFPEGTVRVDILSCDQPHIVTPVRESALLNKLPSLPAKSASSRYMSVAATG